MRLCESKRLLVDCVFNITLFDIKFGMLSADFVDERSLSAAN